ncbi:TonB-dependent receptor [Xanthovirga aplysinae]|uniref:TonB-dependent receptor n=1 Tax=Xanthovirga aplysinae TaxID=2529853 RepID=UPI0012BB59C2|nr:TonB-dependent receptor [Xanthovirga aplysinae]MTI29865.1 TonB-dependent receptor [Xanthovirga aplysinae]
MKKRYLTLSLLLITISLKAQILLSGKVTDQKGEVLPGVNVFLENTYDGATTNLEGNFSFSTSEKGKQKLVASFIGFQSYQEEIELSEEGQTFILKLKPTINKLESVVIMAGSFEASDEKKSVILKPLDIVTTAGAGADIAGALNTLPGTQAVGERGGLYVRGGNGRETKTFIDGMLVHSPYDATLTNLPARGRFSPFLFEGTFFSTGGYSAEYGEALSAALILKTKGLPTEDRTDISFLSVGGELSHTKRWDNSVLTLSGTYTNLQPYFSLVKPEGEWTKAPQGVVLEGIFRKKIRKSGIFKSYVRYSSSDFKLYQSNPEDVLEDIPVSLGNDNFYINTTYKDVLNKKWSLNSGLAFTHDVQKIRPDRQIINQNNQNIHAKLVLNGDFSDRLHLKVGGEWMRNIFEEQYKLNEVSQSFNSKLNENLLSTFAETEFYLSQNLVLRSGFRMAYSEPLNDLNISPRLSMAFKSGEKSQISLAYGTFYQAAENDHLKYNNQLQPEKASHYILNYQIMKKGITFRLEGFYKNYQQLVKYDPEFLYQPEVYNNLGQGHATGIDLFWRDRKTLKNIDYWISYSFLDSKREYLHYPKSAVPHFVSKHNFSLVGKKFIPSIRTQLGVTYTFASGRPYNDPNQDEFNGQKTKAYHDISVNASWLIKPHIILHLSANNLPGFKNEFGYIYSSRLNEEGIYSSKAITPAYKRFFVLGLFITLTKDKRENQLKNL